MKKQFFLGLIIGALSISSYTFADELLTSDVLSKTTDYVAQEKVCNLSSLDFSTFSKDDIRRIDNFEKMRSLQNTILQQQSALKRSQNELQKVQKISAVVTN